MTDAQIIEALRTLAKRINEEYLERILLLSLLKAKGVITDNEWEAAKQQIPSILQEHERLKNHSPAQALDELLQKFEGPKQ